MFFSSPTANITPAMTSVAMSRSDSRDSTGSSSSYIQCAQSYISAYASLTITHIPASWPASSQALARTTSNTSSTTTSSSTCHIIPMMTSSSSQPITSSADRHHRHHQHTSTAMRRGSSSGWIPSPYRSAMNGTYVEEASSYISDDDLDFLTCSESTLPITSIPNPETQQQKQELTTEEQIAILRDMQERDEAAHVTLNGNTHHVRGAITSEEKRKMVRFAGHEGERRGSRRPSTLKRRTTGLRRTLNGPQ